jgi:hypothetical protein
MEDEIRNTKCGSFEPYFARLSLVLLLLNSASLNLKIDVLSDIKRILGISDGVQKPQLFTE